jgi:predicted membrane GTPase involved in stress response
LKCFGKEFTCLISALSVNKRQTYACFDKNGLSDRGDGCQAKSFIVGHLEEIEGRKNGVLISNGSGEANNYALGPLEDRGILFIGHQEVLYEGMLVSS